MREIRRKDRVLPQHRSEELLRDAEYGFLAMADCDGGGYGIPLSYVCKDRDTIYFHCAPEGHKLENIAANDRVCFTVVGNTEVIPDKFTTAYESVLVRGRISVVESPEERLEALRLLVKKYSPGHEVIAEKYISGSFHRTTVLRLCREQFTAKTKKK